MLKSFVPLMVFGGLVAAAAVASLPQGAGADAVRPIPPVAEESTIASAVRRPLANDSLKLGDHFRLGARDSARRVVAVVLEFDGKANHGGVKLLMNGRTLDREPVRAERFARLDLGPERVLGRDLDQLSLRIVGRMFVKAVKVRLAPTDTWREVPPGADLSDFIARLVRREIARNP